MKIPVDEAARLEAVRRYGVLDTPSDGAFNRITTLAARVCDTPVAIVSIVDVDRIWFRSGHGVEIDHVARDEGLCASAILSDGPWVVEDAKNDPRTMANPLVACESGFGFYLGIPLQTTDGFMLGTLCVMDRVPRQATQRQIADLTDLAALVMEGLELRLAARRAILLEAELHHQTEQLARSLQESLMPGTLPDVAGMELAARYVPAHRERVGGDFYDAFADKGTLGLAVGDVCGHGPLAAALASMARHTLRALAVGDWSPSTTLRRLNKAILETSTSDDRRFCTVALLRLDLNDEDRSATISLGGHPHPLLLHADGKFEAIGTTGTLIGWFEAVALEDVTIDLVPGDTIILYSDGLTDSGRGRRAFDEAALQLALASLAGLSAAAVADGILAALAASRFEPSDDVAVLVARLPAADPV